jgi:ABC-2 type transport system permease protein
MTTAGSLTYLRFEVLRAVRNARFFAFSLAFPLVMFLLFAGPNRHNQLDGIPFPVYYLAGMVSWGTMIAVVAGGARIAMERSAGWNRQLRLTPLSAWAYLRAKILGGYLIAVLTIALLYAAGIALGVRLPAGRWAEMTGLVLVGLVPFAAMGIWLGHVLTPDSMGPAMGGITALFAFLGGTWFPPTGIMLRIAKDLPSYWLVQAGHSAMTGAGWSTQGWLVIGVWTAALAALAARAYRRDTKRV